VKLSEARVAWVLPVLGIEGKLLYNKPLFESVASKFGVFKLFTSEFKGDATSLSFHVESCGRFKRLYKNERMGNYKSIGYIKGISVMTPSVVLSLFRFRPDLVVINEFSLFSIYALLAMKLLGKGRVLLIVEAKPRFESSKILNLARVILRRGIVFKTDRILTNNNEGLEYIISELHAPNNKIIVRPFLVSDIKLVTGLKEKEILEHRESRGNGLPVRFLFVGQLVERKGIQYALDAFAKLLQGGRGDFIFDIVGDGPFRGNLERQSIALGLSKHVYFHGKHPYESLWEWYKSGDVFLFPTLADYRALVPFEAMSMGLPIVASIHDGGISETVDSGRNGYSFDPLNVEDFALVLSRFIDTPQLIADFSKQSLKMSSAYTLERASRSLIFACEEALNSVLHV